MTKGSFIAGAHRELSVLLIKCQGSVYRGCANLLARAAGRQVSPGAEVPYKEWSLVTLLPALGAVGRLLVPILLTLNALVLPCS